MLYYLLYNLKQSFFAFNVFKYITVRAALAALTTFFITVVFGPRIIAFLKQLKIQENIRKEGFMELYNKQSYKEGTPTMGGVMIVLSVTLATLLWADVLNPYVLVTLATFVSLALVGFMDDYIKLKKKNSKGLTKTAKFSGQVIISTIAALVLYFYLKTSTIVYMPFLKDVAFDLGILFIPFVIVVICGTSNAVNFTDGLDGLAIGCTLTTALTFSVLSYIVGNMKFSQYLFIPFIHHAGELTVFCAALVGACLGFLWFNCFPANIFMGDVGSLAIGGAIGVVALLIKKEMLLVIVGGIFVAEALSVILQIISFRIFKRRIFKMAPLHHHFQLLGMSESKIIVRAWIISIILAIVTLITLKTQ